MPLLAAFAACQNDTHQETTSASPRNKTIPIPTQVNEKMENEEEYEQARELYWEKSHGGDQGYDWKKIMNDNFQSLVQERMNQTKAVASYANGELAGEWFERGSTNQAGNVRKARYDAVTDAVYAISDGGILWKGDIYDNPWTPLNDSYILGTGVLETIHLPNGDLRLLASVGCQIVYSDDEGQTWTEADGFTGSTEGSGIDLYELNDSTIAYLYTSVNFLGNGTNKFAYSTDHGETFTFVQNMNSWNSSTASMAWVHGSDVAYIINKAHQVYRFTNENLEMISDNHGLTASTEIQLEVTVDGTDTVLYVLGNSSNLYKSTDGGLNFTSIGTTATPAWEVGIGVSIDNPDAVYYGEVDTYRSTDGGNSWNIVSDWWQYYNDPSFYIHADVMDIETFKKSDGTEFTLICNHGGINISYDNCLTTPNIGSIDLNVGQFYDVATSPVNSSFIIGGTQDQGLQRTAAGNVPGTITFDQVISGDYGEQQFSNNGNSFWTEYPGGDFSYYPNATVGGSAYWFDIGGNNMPNANWIIPTGAAPNPADDYILVGGGSATGGDGSYLIKLENVGGTAVATNYPFNFWAEANSAVGAIETTPLDENKFYVSCENGKFYHSEDAGNTWTQSLNLGLPNNTWIWTNDVYASRITDGLVFVGGTNYINSPVWVSTDGGENFVPTGDGIPSTMVHEMCMDEQENFLFAATDAGPYAYSIAQEEWFYIGGTDAPIQNFISCEFIASENIVRFATWGRGIWDFNLSDVSGLDKETAEENNIYPNPSKTGQITISVRHSGIVKVFDLNGKEQLTVGLLPGENKLNLSFLKPGVYVIAGTDEKGYPIQEKLIIE